VTIAAAAVGAALILFLGVIFGSRFGKDPRSVQSPLIGKPSPLIELEYLEEEGFWSLADHGGEIVVVNFWASWCVGCRLEHEALLRTAADYRDRGVVFLGVTFQDDRGESIAFLNEMGRGYSSVVDPGSRTAVEFGVYGIPETFIIDWNGVIRVKIAGESTYSALSSQLDELIDEREQDATQP
jgi:cytochrome c biogenesis protein CcmG/thiol:disulfide interchange protein DsbE